MAVQAVPYWVDDESVRPSMLMSAPATKVPAAHDLAVAHLPTSWQPQAVCRCVDAACALVIAHLPTSLHQRVGCCCVDAACANAAGRVQGARGAAPSAAEAGAAGSASAAAIAAALTARKSKASGGKKELSHPLLGDEPTLQLLPDRSAVTGNYPPLVAYRDSTLLYFLHCVHLSSHPLVKFQPRLPIT